MYFKKVRKGEGQIGKWDVLKMECLKIDNT